MQIMETDPFIRPYAKQYYLMNKIMTDAFTKYVKEHHRDTKRMTDMNDFQGIRRHFRAVAQQELGVRLSAYCMEHVMKLY